MTTSAKCMDIFKAISTNDIHLLKSLLKNGCNVNELRTEFKSTPLHEAVIQANLEMTKLLLHNPYGEKAKVDIKNYYNDEPLFWCKDNPEIAGALLDAGANIETLGSSYNTPLIHSILCSRYKTARLYIDRGANVNATNIFSQTPLIFASDSEDSELVEKLIEKGANINAQDHIGNTPLHIAVSRPPLTENVKILLHYRVNRYILNNNKESPLKVALYNKNINAIKILFANGINPRI